MTQRRALSLDGLIVGYVRIVRVVDLLHWNLRHRPKWVHVSRVVDVLHQDELIEAVKTFILYKVFHLEEVETLGLHLFQKCFFFYFPELVLGNGMRIVLILAHRVLF